jgi:hypothetical protein
MHKQQRTHISASLLIYRRLLLLRYSHYENRGETKLTHDEINRSGGDAIPFLFAQTIE